jgi:hypothetical protein
MATRTNISNLREFRPVEKVGGAGGTFSGGRYRKGNSCRQVFVFLECKFKDKVQKAVNPKGMVRTPFEIFHWCAVNSSAFRPYTEAGEINLYLQNIFY